MKTKTIITAMGIGLALLKVQQPTEQPAMQP